VTTTAIVTEILIVGFQTAAWLGLLLATVFGTTWARWVAAAPEFLLALVGIAAVYVVGIVVDRIADSAFASLHESKAWCWIDRLMGKERPRAGNVGKQRLEVMAASPEMSRFLEYQRSQLRIARATVLNLAVAIPVAAAFAIVRGDTPEDGGSVMVLAIAAVLALGAVYASLFAAVRIDEAYIGRLNDAYEVALRNGGAAPGSRDADGVRPPCPDGRDATPALPRRAAAICYRLERRLELLLVRTKDGSSWTFPKGHIEDDERPADAAAREAREEAGVNRTISPRFLTRYLFPGGQKGERR
jgi:hypothetical protein